MLIGGMCLFWYRYAPIQFSQEDWNAKSGGRPFQRHRMADNLVQRQILIGMSRRQIEALLGDTPNTPYFRDFDLVYRLGDERGLMGIDSEWLVIALDSERIARDAKVLSD